MAAEARAQGWGVPGGHRGLSMGTGQSDVEPCLDGCQPGQGINRSQYPLTLPSPPQGPRNGPRVPVSHGRRKIDLAVLGGGAHIVIVAPTHSASGWGGCWEVGADFRREGAICSDNWCWAAFTQQPACLGRQYLKNIVWKLRPARGLYQSSAGDTEAGPDPAPGLLAILAPLLWSL